MREFSEIVSAAVARCGSLAALHSELILPLSDEQLLGRSDAEYLSLMSRRIFRAGLKHSMVDARWPHFEEVFHEFRPDRVGRMSDEELEGLMQDTRIIRHWGKIRAVRENALAIIDLRAQYESVGRYLSQWPSAAIVDLWHDMKRRFLQLGGNSGACFLRMAGKDTFVLTADVANALARWADIEGALHTPAVQARVQARFNRWHGESGRPFCQISQILARSVA